MSTDVEPWLQGLNPEQCEAVLHDNGPLLILAGAGSGKTTVLVARTGRMLAQKVVEAEQVTVLTFTNKAARELKERVTARLGKAAKGIWAGTFHSFGLHVLREHPVEAGLPQQFGIIDGTDARAIVRDLLKEFYHGGKESFDPEKLLSKINSWRERGQTRAKDEDEYDEAVEVLLPKYLKKLELLGVVDFEGLLMKPLQLFTDHPEILAKYQQRIQQLMVDEFQDTNTIQMKLVSRLVETHKNITVVGDDDQSIYGWRGACISNILDFPRRYDNCKVVRLERNYRSTKAILDIANEVIKKNQKRHDKVLRPASGRDGSIPEVFVYENEEHEVDEVIQQIHHFQREGYAYEDIAILYRSNSQGGLLEASLRHHQIPYSLTGGTAFFDRKEVRDVMAYLRCSLVPNEVALRRILNTPSRGIGEVTLKNLEQFAREHKMSLWKAVQRWQAAGVPERVGTVIDGFLSQLRDLPSAILDGATGESCSERLPSFFRQLGYMDLVLQSYKDAATGHKRWQLVEILGRILDGFIAKGGANSKTLKEFVDCMELRDRVDEASDLRDKSKVQLLTLHACKGLEFPVVIIMGVEEDLLPHQTLGSDIDEERRLFYVGVTRAKEHLVMTRAMQRKRYGKWRPSAPSRFLLEIPPELIRYYETGFRPLNEQDRKSMLADLFQKLDNKSRAKEKEQSI